MSVKVMRYLLSVVGLGIALIPLSKVAAATTWYQQESEHFIVIYKEPHAYLVPHILRSAEDQLQLLMTLFDYTPSEKIVINTYDFSDYGTAGTTTVPHNFIRLEIEPFELGYENIPYNERIQWLIGHELVHVVVNDHSSKVESFGRSLFSKVPPEKAQPLSILYSLLTNFSRYTPRWHQESIAVFMETWLSGGYGRSLGNFDEMYFRSLVLEDKPFPSPLLLDAKITPTSFLLETLSYLYGARFASYLASVYGTEKLLSWFKTTPDEVYQGFKKKFKATFGTDLKKAWEDFINCEKQFQTENLMRLRSSPLTPVSSLRREPLGWVTQPYLDASGTALIFGHHKPHHLTAIKRLDLKTHTLENLGSLPSPSIIQVASTAYDRNLGLLFYTTNNNRLYRDIWVLSTVSKGTKLLFSDCRVGHLTVSPVTHELWGVRHSAGKATLMRSVYPYRTLDTIAELAPGDELQHLAASPSGRYLAATLHQANGRQTIIVADCELLKKNGKFAYKVISADGSPEHPSWSPDESYLYWNAYVNGVSNIYRYQVESSRTEAVSHTLRGLFRPLCLSPDTLFAFEFTTEGFVPVLIPNRPAAHLPAIRYFGQEIVERDPQVTEWVLKPVPQIPKSVPQKRYRGFSHLQFHSLIPVVSGFQSQKVIGLFAHIADPLFVHDFSFEMGVSPFKENPLGPKVHFRGKYEFKRRYRFGIEHNAPNFYDLVNQRKRGMIGTKLTLGHTHYWKYDIPHKIKQVSEIAVYTGIEAINDNLVRVSRPDFLVLQTAIKSRNLRRAIGSVDSEVGNAWTITLMTFEVDPKHPQIVGGLHAEWDHFSIWMWPHNVLHLKLAAGYRHTHKQLAIGKFYFGGFGNRYLENQKVKQFRKVFRFPGIPIYSLAAQRFLKVMVEHNLPPLRFGNVSVGQHYLSHIDGSWYMQGLMVKSDQGSAWTSLGAQINLVFRHWFNLESTLSAGVAQAWNQNRNWKAWFISIKVLKN